MPIKSLDEVHHLYKYRYFDIDNNHIKTISENEFHFATKEELNDPFDLSLRPRFDVGSEEQMKSYFFAKETDKDEYKASKILFKMDPQFHIELLKQAFEIEIQAYRICSFSGNKWDDVLMWAHYSNSCTGFCVGINWEKLSQYLWDYDGGHVTPWIVEYGNDYPLLNPYLDTEFHESYIKMFSYKYSKWSYEDEVRLSMRNIYGETYNIPEQFIDEVILGLKITPENKIAIIDCLKLKLERPKLYQIVQKDNSFEFDRVEINY